MDNQQRSPAVSATALKALAEVRRIVLEVIGSENATIYLFGSWARGNATHTSDIDIAIEPLVDLPRGAFARLRECLEESHIPYHVDVVDLRKVDPLFRRRVMTEGVQWND
jgi:predicted nucleotidyltransferase